MNILSNVKKRSVDIVKCEDLIDCLQKGFCASCAAGNEMAINELLNAFHRQL